MKIMIISAGTKPHGATARAALEAKECLKEMNVDFEFFELYTAPISACSGCGACKKSGKCIHSDKASEIAERIKDFDGYIFFTPVHYGGASGSLKAALGRIFMMQRNALKYKPAAAIAVSRRGGNLTALEEITRFFAFASMPSVSGNYPGIIHGASYNDVEKDLEGLQTVRSIAQNTVWLAECIEAGKKSEIYPPKEEEKIKTSFIR